MEISSENAVENKSTKITDLNSDCLECILQYSEFNDLLSIADSSKHFYQPACIVYKRKFGTKGIVYDRQRFERRYVILEFRY